MKIGIVKYLHRTPLDAMGDGMKVCGDAVTVQHHNDEWPDEAYGGDYDAVMVWGMSPQIKRVLDIYANRGIPGIVIELGHIVRGAYWQVGIQRSNWVPDTGDMDRLKAVAGDLIQPWSQNHYGHILVCGQMPGDAQHEIGDMNKWRNEALARLRATAHGYPLIWRKHPYDRDQFDQTGFDGYYPPETVLFEDALKDAYCLATHNSNTGIKALLAGYPVLCGEGCWYAEAAETDWAKVGELTEPQNRMEFLSRVACAQYSLEEMRDGTAWRFLRPLVEAAACPTL